MPHAASWPVTRVVCPTAKPIHAQDSDAEHARHGGLRAAAGNDQADAEETQDRVRVAPAHRDVFPVERQHDHEHRGEQEPAAFGPEAGCSRPGQRRTAQCVHDLVEDAHRHIVELQIVQPQEEQADEFGPQQRMPVVGRQKIGRIELAVPQGLRHADDDRLPFIDEREGWRERQDHADADNRNQCEQCADRLPRCQPPRACGRQEPPIMKRRYPPDTRAAMSISRPGTQTPRG